ncbi:MAG: hypothetical protein KJ077_08050 [Anaerolineae bacterium]|nr:hypothetical protein [Anaerolineae bacterium]
MNLGELSKDRCIVCGKAVRVINGMFVFHQEVDASHQVALPPDHPLKEAVAPFNMDVHTIQVTPDVSLKYNLADGWFSLVDADNLGYDELGAVLMVVEDIDPLIVALGELRKEVRVKSVGSGL